jgi:hypothetical protein
VTTHQLITEDRNFAQHSGGEVFQVLLLGGRDHEPYDKQVKAGGTRIVKAGSDAETSRD